MGRGRRRRRGRVDCFCFSLCWVVFWWIGWEENIWRGRFLLVGFLFCLDAGRGGWVAYDIHIVAFSLDWESIWVYKLTGSGAIDSLA